MSELKCVFCNGNSDKILLFTQDGLEKCLKINKIRSDKHLKGRDVSLPTTANDLQGYHSKCLSAFKALPKRYKLAVVDNNSSDTTVLPLSGPSKSVDIRYKKKKLICN